MDISTIKRNFIIYSIDGALFSMAMVFISYESILPVLLSRLGASNRSISLIPVLIAMGSNIPGIFYVRRTERAKTRKGLILRWGIGQRLPWLISGLLLPILYPLYPQAMVVVFLFSLMVVTFSTGIMMPAFYDLISVTVPQEKRGMLTSFRSGISYFLGIACGFLVRRILENNSFPANFSILYLIGFSIFCLNLFVFSLVREPRRMDSPFSAQELPRDIKNNSGIKISLLREIKDLLRGHVTFIWYIAARCLLIVSYATCAFYPVYLIERFSLGDQALGTFVIIAGITYILINPILGLIGDKFGYKRIMIINSFVLIAAFIWGRLQVGLPLAFGLIAFASIGRTGNLLLNNMAMEYAFKGSSSRGNIPLYIGVSGLIIGLVSPLGLLSGFFLDHGGYDALFLMTGITSMSALLITVFLVNEPRNDR